MTGVSIPGNAADERLQGLQEFLSSQNDLYHQQGVYDRVLNQILAPGPQVLEETQLRRN